MPDLQLSEDESCLDRLAQADFVGDQEPLARRLEELQQRLELVGVELSSRRPERIEVVAKRALQLGVGHALSKRISISESTLLELRVEVFPALVGLEARLGEL